MNQRQSLCYYLWQNISCRQKLQCGASTKKKNHIPPARPLRRRKSNAKDDLTYLQNPNVVCERERPTDIAGGPRVFPFNLDSSVILQAFRLQEEMAVVFFPTASFLSRDPKEFIDSIFSHFVTLK